MLKLAGESSIGLEKIEQLAYTSGKQDTGDLEAATKTVTATSEASGVGNADYSKALTLPKPSDARLIVKRIATRLAVTIDSFDTATHLYCRVYVDQQDADHRLFDMDWDSTGAKLTAVDTHSGALSTIFDLLKDGASHTFYFFFWIDQANNAVISLVQLWESVGTCDTYGGHREILELNFSGLATIHSSIRRIGTGSSHHGVSPGAYVHYAYGSGDPARIRAEAILVKAGNYMSVAATVSTDISYIEDFYLNIRSEQ